MKQFLIKRLISSVIIFLLAWCIYYTFFQKHLIFFEKTTNLVLEVFELDKKNKRDEMKIMIKEILKKYSN